MNLQSLFECGAVLRVRGPGATASVAFPPCAAGRYMGYNDEEAAAEDDELHREHAA